MMKSRITRLLQSKFVWLSLVTLASVIVVGYHVGGFDQSIHIPFLKKTIDPTLYPHDSFFELRNQHASYFWYLFIPLYRAGLFYQSMFVVHLFATYATFLMVWNIAQLLFKKESISRMATLFLMFPHAAFSGFLVVEFQLLNRTVVLPFVLYCLMLVLQKKMVRAFFLMGILYNFHVITVNFLLIPAGILLLKDYLRSDFKRIPQALGAFLLGAIPVLYWKLGIPSVMPLTIHADWFQVINQGVLNNIFSLFSMTDYVILVNLGGVAVVVMMYKLFKQGSWNEEQQRLWSIGWYSLSVVLVSFALYILLPLTILVQFQLTRAMILTQVIFFIFLAAEYVRQLHARTMKERLLAVGASIFSISPIFILFIQSGILKLKSVHARMFGYLLVLLFVVGSLIYLYGSFWKPGIFITPARSAWIDSQEWAKAHTDIDSIFLTPPHIWSMTIPTWHVYSERSHVAAWSDLLEIAFFPEYYKEWLPRFESVAPRAIEKFEGNAFLNQQYARDAYYSLSVEEIIAIRKQYGARYFVAESTFIYPFKEIYENEEYTIYEIPPSVDNLR